MYNKNSIVECLKTKWKCLNVIHLLLNIWFLVFAYVDAKTGPSHGKVVVCYYSSWAVYRPGNGSFNIDNIDPNLCTHIVYAFAGLNVSSNEIRSLDPWQDLKDNYGKGGYERITGLRSRSPHLKVTLAIGGWTEGSANYSRLAADPVRRKIFVRSATDFIRKYNFDGLDLDWEFPGKRGGEPHDKANFVHLVKELRQEFDKHGLLLTAALGASRQTIDLAYDVQPLSGLLDYLHLMCYDYHGSWDQRVGSNSPLRGEELSVETTVEYMLSKGAIPKKIVLGLPFYGRTFVTDAIGSTRSSIPLGLSAQPAGFQGPYTREDGFMGYNEICVSVNNKTLNWERSWDSEGAQAIAWRTTDGASGKTHVVTYDSTRSIVNKMRYAMKKGLGGAMVWSIDTDDFIGDCPVEEDTFSDFQFHDGLRVPPRTHRNYQLLRAVNEGIVVSLDEIEIDRQNEINNVKDNEIPDGSGSAAKNYVNGIKFVLLALLCKLI